MTVWKAKKYFAGAEIVTVVIFLIICFMMARVPAQYIDPIVTVKDEKKGEKLIDRKQERILSEEEFINKLTNDVPVTEEKTNTKIEQKPAFSKSENLEREIKDSIKVTGTWVELGSPKESCVFIKWQKEPEDMYAPGDPIGDTGASVLSIAYNDIKVRYKGKVFTVSVQEHKASPGNTRNTRSRTRLDKNGPSARHSISSGKNSSSDIKRIRPNSYAVSADMIKPYREQPSKLFTEISVRPQTKNGEPTGGYTVTGMKSDSLLKKVGLRQGDIIMRVNGRNPIDLGGIISDPNLSDVTVDYQRGGRMQRLHFTIQK